MRISNTLLAIKQMKKMRLIQVEGCRSDYYMLPGTSYKSETLTNNLCDCTLPTLTIRTLTRLAMRFCFVHFYIKYQLKIIIFDVQLFNMFYLLRKIVQYVTSHLWIPILLYFIENVTFFKGYISMNREMVFDTIHLIKWKLLL